MLLEARALLEHAIRWLVRNCRPLDVAAAIERYRDGAAALAAALPRRSTRPTATRSASAPSALAQGGVPAATAARAAAMGVLGAALDIVESPRSTGAPVALVTAAYFQAGRPALAALAARPHRRAAAQQPLAGARAGRPARRRRRAAARADDRDPQRGAGHGRRAGGDRALVGRQPAALERYLAMVADMRAARSYDVTTLPVALRELSRLAGRA